jgi:transcription elongation factor Elf1
MNIMTMDSNLTLNKKAKCPKCGSENVVCLDGSGAVSKYGRGVMIDIAPDMWLCRDCKASFRIEDTE